MTAFSNQRTTHPSGFFTIVRSSGTENKQTPIAILAVKYLNPKAFGLDHEKNNPLNRT